MYTSNLSVSARMLHFIIAYVLMPKSSNHSCVGDLELHMLYALKNNISINLAYVIMYHMNHLQKLSGGLPYARLITKILQHCDIDLKREPREDMDVKDCEINDKTALRYISIVLDRDGKFQFQTAYRPLPILVGGYSHEITYNKICSVESTMMHYHQENKFEFTSLKRMMRTLLKQIHKKEVQEENQESGEEEKDDVEDEESGEGEEDEAGDMSESG